MQMIPLKQCASTSQRDILIYKAVSFTFHSTLGSALKCVLRQQLSFRNLDLGSLYLGLR